MSDQKVLELTGCTVEEMLYLINKDTPVIGVRIGASAIILTGYDESHVTYVDSENGESKTVTQEEMDQIMQSSGNAYVGYLKKAEELYKFLLSVIVIAGEIFCSELNCRME